MFLQGLGHSSISLHLAPTWDVVFLEDGEVLLSDPFSILQGDVVDLAADAFHRVLGCSRDMGPTLPPEMLKAVLKKSPRQDTDGKRASVGLLNPRCPSCESVLLFPSHVAWLL